MAQKIGDNREFWTRPIRLPGVYRSELAYARKGLRDARAFVGQDHLTPKQQERLDDSSSIVIAARRKVAQFERGETVCCSKPSVRDFPAAAQIPWLRDVTEVLVGPDDSIRPAPKHPGALS